MDVLHNSTIPPNSTKINDVETVDPPRYFVFVFVQSFFISFEIYLLASFIYYFKKQRNSTIHQRGQRRISRKRKILISLVLFVVIAGGFRSMLSLLTLVLPSNNPTTIVQYCSAFRYLHEVLFVAGLASLYIFLWYRQHTLYALPTMKSLVPRFIKLLSDSMLVFILISAVSITIVFALVMSNEVVAIYIPQSRTCSYIELIDGYANTVNTLAYVTLVLYQGLLLFCIVYILRRHQADMKKHRQSGPSRNNQSRSLPKLIPIYIKAASICMVTDVITLVVAFFLSSSAQLYVLYDVDYVINLSCAIVCFSSWKEMIDPWRLRKSIKRVFCCKNLSNNIQTSTLSIPITIATKN